MVGSRKTDLVDLHACILADNTSTTAWRIQQHPIEPTDDLREFSTIVVADNDVLAPHSMDIGAQALRSGFGGVVGKYHAGILHQSGDMSSLAAWCRGHIEDTLVGLGIESEDGKEGRGGL